MVGVPEFTFELAHRMKSLEGDEFPVECFVIVANLTSSAWVIGSAEDQFDTVFLRFCFEQFRDELFTIIEINFTRDSSDSECPL
jgi:hypothetical protein